MRVSIKISAHSTTQLAREIDMRAVEDKVRRLPNAQLQDSLKSNHFNIMDIDLSVQTSTSQALLA